MNRNAVVVVGRDVLRRWLHHAEAHGTIYATVPGPARKTHCFNLYTVAGKSKPALVKLWPTLSGADARRCDIDLASAAYSDALDIIARDWGFSFPRRCFVLRGGGMDMLFELVDNLSIRAGIRGEGNKLYAHRVQLERIQ